MDNGSVYSLELEFVCSIEYCEICNLDKATKCESCKEGMVVDKTNSQKDQCIVFNNSIKGKGLDISTPYKQIKNCTDLNCLYCT